MSSYNKSDSGNTTVEIEGFRITIEEKFEEFDEQIKNKIRND